MKLVVGLGNPGYEYHLTPHNLGFMAADRLAEDWGIEISRPEAQSLTGSTEMEGEQIILAKPQTFMNLSGMSVARLLSKYSLVVEDMIVLVDEINLPLGAIRVRPHGSAGGHNGLKSIIGVLQSDEFARVRMGVQPSHQVADRVSYLLTPFRKADLETVTEAVDRAVEATRMILKEGTQKAMNRFNRRNSPTEA